MFAFLKRIYNLIINFLWFNNIEIPIEVDSKPFHRRTRKDTPCNMLIFASDVPPMSSRPTESCYTRPPLAIPALRIPTFPHMCIPDDLDTIPR